MDFRGLEDGIDGIMKLAVVGFFAIMIGLPVGLFFLIRWLWLHVQWQ